MKKLAELNGIELSDVLCKIAEPVARIMADPAADACFAQLGEAMRGGGSALINLTRCLMIVSPVFLSERNRMDTFRVAAGLKGCTVDEVIDQPGTQTVQELLQMVIYDGGLMSIFRPARAGKSEAAAGGAV